MHYAIEGGDVLCGFPRCPRSGHRVKQLGIMIYCWCGMYSLKSRRGELATEGDAIIERLGAPTKYKHRDEDGDHEHSHESMIRSESRANRPLGDYALGVDGKAKEQQEVQTGTPELQQSAGAVRLFHRGHDRSGDCA